MIWLIGLVLVFTVLGFAAAIIASQIMAIVHGTPVQAALEDRCKQSWNRFESLLGYHPLNQGLWIAIIKYPAMPANTQAKQRALRVIFALQIVVSVAAMVGMIALTVLH